MASTQVDVKAVITAEDRASGVLSGFGETTRSAANKIAVGMAVAGAGLTLFAKNATDFTTDLATNTKKLSRETGIATDTASALLYATGRLGVSAEQTSQVFGIFSKKIVETKDASDPTTTSLGQLHIAVKRADGSAKSFNDILKETADKFKSLPDGPQKTALALDLFGRSGKDMIKVLNVGSQGIQQLENKAKELGLVLTSTNLGAVSKYIESQKNLADSTNALKIQVGTLTAPVLTAFNEKLNTVITALISADNPFRNLVIDVIAFGGPVATAAGGLVSLTANLATSIQAMGGLRAATAATGAFITGPFGIALGIAGVAIVSVVQHLLSQKSAADQLRAANQNLTTSTDILKNSQLSLAGAQLSERQASLQVEQAQRSYTEAVKQYGPKSLEARQALLNLQQAQLGVRNAHVQAHDALNKLHDAEKQVAKDRVLIQHLREVGNEANTIARQALYAGQQIRNIDGSHITVRTTQGTGLSKGVQQIDFAATFGGGRASGGPVEAGTPYIVGERGPEIFMPTKDGTIIPNQKSSPAFNKTPQTGYGVTNLNITIQAGALMGSDVEARKFAQIILDHLKQLGGKNNLSVAQLLGV